MSHLLYFRLCFVSQLSVFFLIVQSNFFKVLFMCLGKFSGMFSCPFPVLTHLWAVAHHLNWDNLLSTLLITHRTRQGTFNKAIMSKEDSYTVRFKSLE
jgi:hypothetical protein